MAKSTSSRLVYPLLMTLLAILFLKPPVYAQDSSENSYNALQENFKTEYLSVSTLLQAQGFFYADPEQGQNRFQIGTARLGISGEVDNDVSYKLLADFSRIPVLLDMTAGFRVWDRMTITVGAQKPGISAGFLLPAAATDFINRPLIASILAGNRDIGVLTETELTDEVILTAGVFNGTNQNLSNNDNLFYYTGRLLWSRSLENGDLQIGINGAYSHENGTRIGNRTLPLVNGKRLIYGVDFRYADDAILFSGEFLTSDLEYSAAVEDNVWGYHLTAGYNVTSSLQLLARYDHAESEIQDLDEDIITAGANYSFTEVAGFTLNYRYIPEGPVASSHGLLLQTQIAF